MNTIRLLVLGTIRQLGIAHGYAVRKKLTDWRVETWTTVRSGSVYHAIGQLHKEGKLSAHDNEIGARGAERTAFSLTDAGEAEFFTLMEAALSSFELQDLSAGVAFMGELPPARARSLLENLEARLRANRDTLAARAQSGSDDGRAPRTHDLLAIWIGYLDSTAASVAQLRRKIG